MCVNMARHLVPRLTKGMGCGDHDHAHSFLFLERVWLIVVMARYLVPLLTKGIGGGAHGHIPPSTSTQREGRVVSSLHTPSSSGKGNRCDYGPNILFPFWQREGGGGCDHDHIHSFLFYHKEGLVVRSIHIPSSSGKGGGSAHGPNTLLHF